MIQRSQEESPGAEAAYAIKTQPAPARGKALLRRAGSLKDLIVIQEILGPPKAQKDYEEN